MAEIQTTVNSQITDAVTQTNVSVVGEAPAQSMAMVYQSMAHAMSLLMQNSVLAQGGMQQINSAVVATACQRIMTLPSQKEAPAPPSPSLPPSSGQPFSVPPNGNGNGNGSGTGNGNGNGNGTGNGDLNAMAALPPGNNVRELKHPNFGMNLMADVPDVPDVQTISNEEKMAMMRASANDASKAAEFASEASLYYAEAQLIAEHLLENAIPNDDGVSINKAKTASATSHNAATESKKASQASEAADVLYEKIFQGLNSQEPNKDEVTGYLQQLSQERLKAENAKNQVKQYLQQVQALQSSDS